MASFVTKYSPNGLEVPLANNNAAIGDAQWKELRQKLTQGVIFKNEKSENDNRAGVICGDHVEEQTKARYEKLKGDSKTVELAYLNYQKHYIQCSNLIEFYDNLDKGKKWHFCRLQRCHNAKDHVNILKIFKKKDDKQTVIYDTPISHKDAFCFASNITPLCVGQFVFILKIEKISDEKYKIIFEHYNLHTETKKVYNTAEIATKKKISPDIIKFINARKFSAPITEIEEDKALEYV